MSTLFKGATNGGANTVRYQNGDLNISGQAVSGKQSLDASLIASVWGGTLTESATLKAGSDLNDLNDAKISIKATGGEAFIIEQLAAIGVSKFNFGPSQNQDPVVSKALVEGRIKDFDDAINGASIREDSGGGFEIRLSGGGVGGAFNTNADFATYAEAEVFLDSLKAELGQKDAYSVVVEDDDLDGRFAFEFEGWYKDVNYNKIEGKLAGSDVHFDGDIDSKAEGAAANLALFLEQMATGGDEFVFKALESVGTGDGNLNQVEKFGPKSIEVIASKFTGDLEDILGNAALRSNDNGWEVQFGGSGVSGAVATNADFATEADAQAFLDSLIAAQPGFLDDALF